MTAAVIVGLRTMSPLAKANVGCFAQDPEFYIQKGESDRVHDVCYAVLHMYSLDRCLQFYKQFR